MADPGDDVKDHFEKVERCGCKHHGVIFGAFTFLLSCDNCEPDSGGRR